MQSNSDLLEEDIERIRSFSVSQRLQRNEFILREQEICRHKIFVVSGLLRNFNMTADGNEYIIRFSQENTWTLDKESYDLQIPANTSISAVEPSIILTWSKSDFEKLSEEFYGLKSLTTKLTADNIYTSSKRLMTMLSATPEEKYLNFVQNSPDLLLRLPLKMIASYLGLSLRTLDRIRHQQLPH